MSDSDAKDATLSVKAMINKERTKVLFVEAGRDFTDVLLSFLALPLGKMLKLLENHYGDEAPVFGSLSTLYKSLVDLDDANFATKAAKEMLLNPRTSFATECRNLKFDITDSQPTTYFECNNISGFSRCRSNVRSLYEAASCDACGNLMKIENYIYVPESAKACAFLAMNDEVSFLISDHLRIMPSSTAFLQTLKCFGIEDLNGAELMNVTFGNSELIGLLKLSLISETPLTDLILKKAKKLSSASKPRETGNLLNPVGSSKTTSTLKVMMQKSTEKLLFAQSEDDFVDLLFSFFTFPLGLVESLLDKTTCFKNIDNLYNSLADAVDDKHLTSPLTKIKLMNPNLPYGYASKDQFLPLNEDDPPDRNSATWKSPKGPGNYVKKARTFMINDDLRVTNFHVTSGINFLTRFNIPLWDVYEQEVKVGPAEALNMLRVSLTSTCALTDGLMINHKFKKQPEQKS